MISIKAHSYNSPSCSLQSSCGRKLVRGLSAVVRDMDLERYSGCALCIDVCTTLIYVVCSMVYSLYSTVSMPRSCDGPKMLYDCTRDNAQR